VAEQEAQQKYTREWGKRGSDSEKYEDTKGVYAGLERKEEDIKKMNTELIDLGEYTTKQYFLF